MSSISNKTPIGTALVFVVFLAVMLVTYIAVKPSPPPAELLGVLRPEYKMLSPFKLTDHNNGTFDEARFKGKWSFIFFGYTFCPDVCPGTLQVLNRVEENLKRGAEEISSDRQVIFVSVDPVRDTPQRLAEYITYFNDKFVGATSGKQQIDGLTRQFGAGYMIEEEYAPDQYVVAHTSAIFLVDPFGRLVATFSQPHYPEIISAQYEKIREYFIKG